MAFALQGICRQPSLCLKERGFAKVFLFFSHIPTALSLESIPDALHAFHCCCIACLLLLPAVFDALQKMILNQKRNFLFLQEYLIYV